MGFTVINENQCYRLDPGSPFFLALSRSVNFSEVEATFLHRLLDGADEKNPIVSTVKRKLERFYHLRQFTDTRFQAHNIEILHTLMEAIKQQDRKSNTSELQSRQYLVCRLLLEKKKKNSNNKIHYRK